MTSFKLNKSQRCNRKQTDLNYILGANEQGKGVNAMHWIMWVFWGFFATLIVVVTIVDVLTKRKYSFHEQEKTLNQNSAINDAKREVGRIDQHFGPF